MKIGIRVPNYARWWRGDALWATCEKGKEIGLDSLFFVDHVIFTPAQYVGYGNGYMDIWTAMSYVAAITNIQGWQPILANGIWVVPYRPPIQVAKVIATVDSLSGGRVMIGAGSGYNEQEFAALGLNVKERGDMTDEYLACCKELWSNPVASFHGKYVNFDEMTISVRPVQPSGPPIMYGSRGLRPFRRIAERYDGWIAGGGTDAESLRAFETDWAQLNSMWKENGREGKPYLIMQAGGHITADRSMAGQQVVKGISAAGSPPPGVGGRVQEGQERAYVSTFNITHTDDLVTQLRTFSDLGADMVVVNLPSYRFGDLDNLGMQLNQMETLAEHVMPKIPKG